MSNIGLYDGQISESELMELTEEEMNEIANPVRR